MIYFFPSRSFFFMVCCSMRKADPSLRMLQPEPRRLDWKSQFSASYLFVVHSISSLSIFNLLSSSR